MGGNFRVCEFLEVGHCVREMMGDLGEDGWYGKMMRLKGDEKTVGEAEIKEKMMTTDYFPLPR